MNDKKLSANRQKKEKIVAELVDKVIRAKSFIFAEYQGLTHQQMEALKRKIRESNAEFVVTKNTLLKIALEKGRKSTTGTKSTKGKKTPATSFKNSTATIFVYDDPIGALKELAKSFKELKLPAIKFGIVDGQSMSGDDLLKLSTLPPREVLLVQLVGGLASPIFGLHRALSWNLQKFAMTLQAVANNKSQAPNNK